MKTLKLAAIDLTNKEIADQMYISDKTAKKHRQNNYEKLNIHGKCTIRRFLKYFEALF